MVDIEASPSEQTPLIASSSPNHDSKQNVSFRRGLSIIILMGLLIFIQGASETSVLLIGPY